MTSNRSVIAPSAQGGTVHTGFDWIRPVWEISNLSRTETLVLQAIVFHADGAGSAYPSVARLAKLCKLGERQTRAVIKTIAKKGYLFVDVGAGPHGCNMYYIRGCCPHPRKPASGAAAVDNDAPRKPSAGTPVAGNQQPLKPTSPKQVLNIQEQPDGSSTRHSLVEVRDAVQRSPSEPVRASDALVADSEGATGAVMRGLAARSPETWEKIKQARTPCLPKRRA